MKITKIKIKNLFGISEFEADEKSLELLGGNGTGKTSVLDAIRFALTNRSTRNCIVKNGATEGEIIIETDAGLTITRKPRTNKTDYKSIKQDGKEIQSPEAFLSEIFSELQLNPVSFINMDSKEQNRIILDLIEYNWNDKCLVEVEVKISKSDFRREFEAATLKNGTFMLQIHIEGTDLVTCTALIAMAVIVWSITRK